MLQLALLRHAKSSWDTPELEDFDRPLNARGMAAAPLMAAHMASLGFMPSLVLCSPAVRTRQTFEYVKAAFATDAYSIRFDDEIYLAGAADLLDLLHHRGGKAEKLLLIGHNPGLQALAMMLAGNGDPHEIAAIAAKFPTAALAILAFDAASQWRDIKPSTGRLQAYAAPKLLA